MGAIEERLGEKLQGLNLAPTYEEMLWDSFATEAMGALIGKDLKAVTEKVTEDVYEVTAMLSYVYADAMMTERQRRKEQQDAVPADTPTDA